MGRVRWAAETVVVAVAPEVVYEAVSDVASMGRWSPVNQGATLTAPGPLRVGDTFVGHNRAGRWRWSTQCTVVAARHGREFAFEVSVLGVPVSRWAYRLRVQPPGTEVTESWQDLRRGPVGSTLYAVTRCALRSGDPAEATHRSMRRTLDRLKDELEGPARGPES